MAPSKRKRASTVAAPNGNASKPTRPEPGPEPKDPKTALRDMWEFAALWQFCSIFREALGLPEILMEDLELELLDPTGMMNSNLHKIQVALLRQSTLRFKLELDQFDETIREAFEDLEITSPYTDECSTFAGFDAPTKVRTLHRLTNWALANPEQLRDRMSESPNAEWRIDPCGFDKIGNTYYVLDDNRLYRLTPAPEPTISTSTPRKGSKKRKVVSTAEELPRNGGKGDVTPGNEVGEWSCVCITLQEWQAFAEKFRKSKHPDEKAFYEHLVGQLLPVIEKEEEARQKKIAEHKRKLELEALVANRKRSSRVDARLARQKEEEELAEKRRAEEERKELERQEKLKKKKMLQEREKRLEARDERIQKRKAAEAERAAKEAAKAEAKKAKPPPPPPPEPSRKSTRARQSTTVVSVSTGKTTQRWDFDCICGVHGTNFDDGTLLISCDNCEIWQHVSCLNLPEDRPEGEFICERCVRKAKEAEIAARIAREQEEIRRIKAEEKARRDEEARKRREEKKAEERRRAEEEMRKTQERLREQQKRAEEEARRKADAERLHAAQRTPQQQQSQQSMQTQFSATPTPAPPTYPQMGFFPMPAVGYPNLAHALAYMGYPQASPNGGIPPAQAQALYQEYVALAQQQQQQLQQHHHHHHHQQQQQQQQQQSLPQQVRPMPAPFQAYHPPPAHTAQAAVPPSPSRTADVVVNSGAAQGQN